MWNGKTVSVVLPAFNEEDSIRRCVEDFWATGVVDEVIVIDNNSTDASSAEAEMANARVIREPVQGFGAALTRGFREANCDLVVSCEPDGTFVCRDVLKLLAYAEDFDLVCGTRTTKELIWEHANMGRLLRSGNGLVAKLLEVLHNTCGFSDCGCTMRLIDRRALDKISHLFTVKGSHFLPEMVILARKQQIPMIEVPVNYCPRLGTSKITGSLGGILSAGLHMIWLIIRYRFKR